MLIFIQSNATCPAKAKYSNGFLNRDSEASLKLSLFWVNAYWVYQRYQVRLVTNILGSHQQYSTKYPYGSYIMRNW